MNKEIWKEARKYNSRRWIIYYWSIFKLKILKWYIFHLRYRLTKYKHKHIWSNSVRCYICRRTMMDIDRERIKKKRDENEATQYDRPSE